MFLRARPNPSTTRNNKEAHPEKGKQGERAHPLKTRKRDAAFKSQQIGRVKRENGAAKVQQPHKGGGDNPQEKKNNAVQKEEPIYSVEGDGALKRSFWQKGGRRHVKGSGRNDEESSNTSRIDVRDFPSPRLGGANSAMQRAV